MLESMIVAAPVGRYRPAFGRKILGQLDDLIDELHARHAHAQAKDALQLFKFAAVHFNITDLFKTQNLGEKLDGSVQIGDRHADIFYGLDELGEGEGIKN